MAAVAPRVRRRLESRVARRDLPRIAFVKQDVQDDLYCCAQGSSARDIVLSTLMRTGPVALFTKLEADCYIVETEPDPECNVWQQKWQECHWTRIEDLEALRDAVPGRPYGQSRFAVKAQDVDWRQYGIVISVDVSVPARITRQYPSTTWCYYVREPKTSAYARSQKEPIEGQDLFLNQCFRPGYAQQHRLPHEVEFPYYLQYHGCFNELLSAAEPASHRQGVFLEHHTPEHLSQDQVRRIEEFGPVESTAPRSGDTESGFGCGFDKSTMGTEGKLRKLMECKYFVKCGGRSVWGNAMVEAVAAGCVAIGDPMAHGHSCLFTRHTSANSFEQVVERISRLESDERLYNSEAGRQRRLVDYLCYAMPSSELIGKAARVVSQRH